MGGSIFASVSRSFLAHCYHRAHVQDPKWPEPEEALHSPLQQVGQPRANARGGCKLDHFDRCQVEQRIPAVVEEAGFVSRCAQSPGLAFVRRVRNTNRPEALNAVGEQEAGRRELMPVLAEETGSLSPVVRHKGSGSSQGPGNSRAGLATSELLNISFSSRADVSCRTSERVPARRVQPLNVFFEAVPLCRLLFLLIPPCCRFLRSRCPAARGIPLRGSPRNALRGAVFAPRPWPSNGWSGSRSSARGSSAGRSNSSKPSRQRCRRARRSLRSGSVACVAGWEG